jgi:tetratricopeptide (TPR) repeat protein
MSTALRMTLLFAACSRTASYSVAQTAAWELHAQGKMMPAIEQMKAAVELSAPGEIPDPRFGLGCMWEDIGYLDEAESVFRGLSAEHGRWKTYLANVLLDGRGQRELALALYREACDATQDYPGKLPLAAYTNSLYGRGVCADSLGQADEAEECHRCVRRSCQLT